MKTVNDFIEIRHKLFFHRFFPFQPILFSVEVWEEDSTSSNDLIDRYSLAIQTNPSPSHFAASRRHKLSGKGHSFLNVGVKVFCDASFFIPDCTTYCTPRDDSSGHYSCDFTRGLKVCLPGWYGRHCLTYGMPLNDTLGHYSCDSNGQIKCLNNWYGKDCLLYCKARNDSLGHYSCDVNGQRRCLSGWYGKDCLTYCVSRNDSLGHYRCDVNGRRKCLFGWHGSYCLTYCDSLGHYICGSNGQKSCLDYWYGTNCLIYCKPRNDSTGHYICNSTGYSVCLLGWQGEQCTEKEISKATYITASTTICGSTKSFQHQKTSSKVTSLLGNFSLRTDALIFRSTFAVGPFASKDGGVQSTEMTKLALFSSQLFELASRNKQTTSSFQHLSQFSAPDSKTTVSTSTCGEILETTEKQSRRQLGQKRQLGH